jgi:hypothetical protein
MQSLLSEGHAAVSAITWFKSSPCAGDPSCLCSWCEQRIDEDDAPILRLWNTHTNQEARFHLRCAAKAGIVSPPPADTFDGFEYGEMLP